MADDLIAVDPVRRETYKKTVKLIEEYKNTVLLLQEEKFCTAVFEYTGRSPLKSIVCAFRMEFKKARIIKESSNVFQGYITEGFSNMKLEIFTKKNKLVLRIGELI